MVWWVLCLLFLCVINTANSAPLDPEPITSGGQKLIEFTEIIPSMDELLSSVFKVMASMDLPGVVDTVSRLVAGTLALLTFGIAYCNYALEKRINLFGLDGSFGNMVMAAMAIILIAVGVPRLTGEAGWAIWRVTYTTVETAVHPQMDEMIKDRTEKLAQSVWDYSIHGISAGWTPMSVAADTFKGDGDIPADAMTGAATAQDQQEKVKEAKASNDRYRVIWQIGSLLVAGMFMAYIGVVFGSGLFVAFSALFMPLAFAFIPLNSSVFVRSLGGMISSIFVAGVAPGLMLVNVMIIFDGPIMYMNRMMENQTKVAQVNTEAATQAIQSCVGKAANDPELVGALNGMVQGVIDPMNQFFETACVWGKSGLMTFMTMGQSLTYIIIGLIVVGMLFIGLSALAMMTFKEFKSVVDGIFAHGGGVGNGGTGRGRALANAAGNRLLGASAMAAGMMSGNSQLASAGARSVASGRDALPSAVAGYSSGRQKRQDDIKRADQFAAQYEQKERLIGAIQNATSADQNTESKGSVTADQEKQSQANTQSKNAKFADQADQSQAKTKANSGGAKQSNSSVKRCTE